MLSYGRGARTTFTFEEVKYRTSKEGCCPRCGARRKRSTTFFQTINPWNRDADGCPKTRSQIMDELRERAQAWRPDFTCTTDCSVPELPPAPTPKPSLVKRRSLTNSTETHHHD